MKPFLLGPLLFLIPACKTTRDSGPQQPVVKPSALIGTAYDAHTQEFTGMSCLDVGSLHADDYERTALGEPRTDVKDVVSEAELENVFGFFQKSFYSPVLGLRLSRPYETVQRIMARDNEVIRLLLVQGERGVLRFRSEGRARLRLTPDAERLVQNILVAPEHDRPRHVEAFVQACGTGFLSGTHYAMGMAAVLRWIFKSPEEKERLAAKVQAQMDAGDESAGGPGDVRLRYEIFLKESRDINLRLLGERNQDCPPNASKPCLDAFHSFRNATLPAWERSMKKLSRSSDWLLPQAYLSQPEITAYHEIEPALSGVVLEPDERTATAWREARSRFVDLHVKVLRQMQTTEPQAAGLIGEGPLLLQDLLNRISHGAAACFRPQLDLALCHEKAGLLEADAALERRP